MTTEEAPAATDIEQAVAFQRALYLYWWAARAIGGLPLTSRGFVARPALRRLRGQWPVQPDDRAEGDDARGYFLRRLLERLGLLRPAGTDTTKGVTLLAAEPAMMARFVAHPLSERLRICTRLWVAGGWWPDGKPAGEALGLHAPLPPRIALTRRRLIELLAATEPGDLLDIPGLPANADLAPRIIGATAARRKPRDIAEERAQTMRAALTGPLQWLGLVARRSGGSPDGAGWVATMGALALRNGQNEAEIRVREVPGRVVIQPNLDIVAYAPLTAPTLVTLDRCAARGSLERVAHYRLTREDVTRAHQSGWSDDETARRLELLTGTPLPGNVRVRLADWTRAANRIRLTANATVLTAASPELLDALLADRNGRDWVLRRLGPTQALVASEHLETVRRWLLARGELPAVERPSQ